MGWLPDPTGRFDQRYRTRTGWTRRVRVGDAEAVDEVADTDTPPDAPPQQRQDAPGPRWRAAGGQGSRWRPDPTGRFEHRWWDGTHFTRRVRHAGSVATDTVSPPQSRRHRGRAGSDDEQGAGWRPDPDGEGERYHDGHDWTAATRPAVAQRTGRPGSLRAWLPRSVAVALCAAAVLALVVAFVLAVALLG